MAHYDLCCLQIQLFASLVVKELKANRQNGVGLGVIYVYEEDKNDDLPIYILFNSISVISGR